MHFTYAKETFETSIKVATQLLAHLKAIDTLPPSSVFLDTSAPDDENDEHEGEFIND